MGEILDKYESLTMQTKAIIVLVFIVLTSGLHYFFFMSQSETQDSLLTRRANLEEKKFEYETKNKTLEIEKKFNRDLERALALKKGNLPDNTEIERVIALLDRKAEQAGVKIDNITPKEEIVKELYVEKPLEMKISGSFHKIMNFLYTISKAERIINMDNILLDSPVYKNQEVSLVASLVLKVYRFKKSTDISDKDKKKKKKKKKK